LEDLPTRRAVPRSPKQRRSNTHVASSPENPGRFIGVGTTVDVRTNNLNNLQRRKLRKLLKNYRFNIYVHSDHWHCTLRA